MDVLRICVYDLLDRYVMSCMLLGYGVVVYRWGVLFILLYNNLMLSSRVLTVIILSNKWFLPLSILVTL